MKRRLWLALLCLAILCFLTAGGIHVATLEKPNPRVQEPLTSGPLAMRETQSSLFIDYPERLESGTDGTLVVIVKHAISTKGTLTIAATSNELKLNPATPREISLPTTAGDHEGFIISSREAGEKVIRLDIRVQPRIGSTALPPIKLGGPTFIRVDVVEPTVLFGLTRPTLETIQVLSTSIGLPSLVAAIAAFLFSNWRKKKDAADAQTKTQKIIIP